MNGNLALGLNTESDVGILASLTRGERGDTDGRGFTRLPCGAHSLALDLGREYAVSGASLGFLHNPAEAHLCPSLVCFSLSLDGERFYRVGSVSEQYGADISLCVRADYVSDFGDAYRARFVRADFSADSEALVDEFAVFGAETAGDEALPSGQPIKIINKNTLAPRDSLGEYETLSVISCDGFELSAAAVESAVKYSDALVLSFGGECRELSYYERVLDGLFSVGKAVFALAADSARLGKSAPLGIFISVPIPRISLSPFGNVSGSGISKKLLTTDDCVDAYLWFVDNIIRRFSALDIPEVRFCGMMHDKLSVSRLNRSDERELLKAVASKLRERNLKSLLVCGSDAPGNDTAHTLGFDCVALLPNGDLESGLARAKRYGCALAVSLRSLGASAVERVKNIAEETVTVLFPDPSGALLNEILSEPKPENACPNSDFEDKKAEATEMTEAAEITVTDGASDETTDGVTDGIGDGEADFIPIESTDSAEGTDDTVNESAKAEPKTRKAEKYKEKNKSVLDKKGKILLGIGACAAVVSAIYLVLRGDKNG